MSSFLRQFRGKLPPDFKESTRSALFKKKLGYRLEYIHVFEATEAKLIRVYLKISLVGFSSAFRKVCNCKSQGSDMKQRDGYLGILKQGYLLKKSELLKTWNLRYFVLSKECLCYYRNEQESKTDAPKELIFFNDISLYIEELPDKHTKYCLKIVKKSLSPKTASRTYLLCCFSEEERNEWLSQILLAKAMALVMDPTALIKNQDTQTEALNFELPNLARADRITSAKEVLRRCQRKLSLRRNIRRSPSCTSIYDLNANKLFAVKSNTLLNLTTLIDAA